MNFPSEYKTEFLKALDTIDLSLVNQAIELFKDARAKGRQPLPMVRAWAARQRLVPAQEAVDEKSNEIVAIPLLLERLQ